jgi:hypothetical protein
MSKRTWFGLALVLLTGALALAAPASAAGGDGDRALPRPGSLPAAEDGWREVAKGFWKRTLADGHHQAVASGPDGLRAALAELNAQLVNLVVAYLNDPTDDMQRVLDTHLAYIESVEAGILRGETGDLAGGPVGTTACTTDWSASAGGAASCTTTAKGTASYTGPSTTACFGVCYINSYAFVSRTVCDDTVYTASQSCSNSGINISCSSSASLNNTGIKSCYGYGYGSVYCPDISWTGWDDATTTACGTAVCRHCAEE